MTRTTMVDILKLQSRDVGGKPGDDAGHLPWSQVITRRPHRAAVAEAVMLFQSTDWIGGRSDIEAGMAHGGSQEIATIEGRYGSNFHVSCMLMLDVF